MKAHCKKPCLGVFQSNAAQKVQSLVFSCSERSVHCDHSSTFPVSADVCFPSYNRQDKNLPAGPDFSAGAPMQAEVWEVCLSAAAADSAVWAGAWESAFLTRSLVMPLLLGIPGQFE